MNADGQINDGLLGNNLFAYCENNPVMRADNSGCRAVEIDHSSAWVMVGNSERTISGGYTRLELLTTAIAQSNIAAAEQAMPNPSPNLNSKYYTAGPLASFSGNCTWYCYGRALELTGNRMPICDARRWYEATMLPKGNRISKNSIAVFRGGDHGHVVFIECINVAEKTVSYSEYNFRWQGWQPYQYSGIRTASYDDFIKEKENTGLTLIGYIYTTTDNVIYTYNF